ncbi:hypothetical protein Tco_0290664 [Tanacetum coccineum]
MNSFLLISQRLSATTVTERGHFARECRSGRSQGRRPYGDNGRSNAQTTESLISGYGGLKMILGGYDWSNDQISAIVNPKSFKETVMSKSKKINRNEVILVGLELDDEKRIFCVLSKMVNNMTTVGTRVVVSKGKVENVLKKAKWGQSRDLVTDPCSGGLWLLLTFDWQQCLSFKTNEDFNGRLYGFGEIRFPVKDVVQDAQAQTSENAFQTRIIQIIVGTIGKIPIDASTLPNADLPIDPNMPDLEDASVTLLNDGIFNEAYDDDEDCKKQTLSGKFTTEAEYVATAHCWISMDLRMDRSSPGKYNSSMVFHMANLKYSDKHNMVAFLKKPNESVGFTEVVDFLKGTSLRYALTHNPTIYDSLVKQFWQTATVRTLANGTQQLVASIDSKEYTITEASVRSKLQLAHATGIHNLSDVSTGSTKFDSGTTSKRGQREGKATMVEEDIQATHKTKEQMRQEKAGLEEAIKFQAQLDEEVAKQIHLDKMIAKRMAEMVKERKKHFAEERAKEKRNKPMTQSQLRIYMSNYLKNQGTWKLSQLKKLKTEEIKEEFDKLVQQIDTFVPINLETIKAKLKRYGEELQIKTSKKQKIDDKDCANVKENCMLMLVAEVVTCFEEGNLRKVFISDSEVRIIRGSGGMFQDMMDVHSSFFG